MSVLNEYIRKVASLLVDMSGGAGRWDIVQRGYKYRVTVERLDHVDTISLENEDVAYYAPV